VLIFHQAYNDDIEKELYEKAIHIQDLEHNLSREAPRPK
jgi:hypothetical protein